MTKVGRKVFQNCKFYDPGLGVPVLGHGRISRVVKMNDFLKTFSSLLLGINQTNLVYVKNEGGRGSLARAWPYVVDKKCIISLKFFFSTPGHR